MPFNAFKHPLYIFHFSSVHNIFLPFPYYALYRRKSGPNECSQKRTEALTLNGHVSPAKSLMDDANYHKLGRPDKGSGSIPDTPCFTHSQMLDDDICSKHGTRQECSVGVGCGGQEGEDQDYSMLSFSMCFGSKRIPKAFIKTDNGRGKSNVWWRIKEDKRASS